MTATITSQNGIQVSLTGDQVRLLHKACHKMAGGLIDQITDAVSYYSGNGNPIVDQMKAELDRVQKLRVMIEDLED